MMAHGGTSAGSFIQTLRMVDVPPGGPSALSLVNRDGSLVVEVIKLAHGIETLDCSTTHNYRGLVRLPASLICEYANLPKRDRRPVIVVFARLAASSGEGNGNSLWPAAICRKVCTGMAVNVIWPYLTIWNSWFLDLGLAKLVVAARSSPTQARDAQSCRDCQIAVSSLARSE